MMRVLLAEQPGEVLSREFLIETVDKLTFPPLTPIKKGIDIKPQNADLFVPQKHFFFITIYSTSGNTCLNGISEK